MRVRAVSTTPTALVEIAFAITNQITVSTRIVTIRARLVGVTLRNESTPASVGEHAAVGVEFHRRGKRAGRHERGEAGPRWPITWLPALCRPDEAVGRAQTDGEPGAQGDQPDRWDRPRR